MTLSQCFRSVVFALLSVVVLWGCQTAGPDRSGRTLIATYTCKLPNPKLGSHISWEIYDNGWADMKMHDVVIEGIRDPEAGYEYTVQGSEYHLTRNSHGTIGLDTLVLDKNKGTLTIEGAPKTFSCV